ncbi:cytochrome C oxidase caa3-type, assembly factor CtaG-like protein [Lysobacteraceae bacterium NML93-0399]|nr:cytochrome C oxidase caa3-type, assembly factor CtaG-like protein [Xanthomonadaceae bacterium NML93-0399]
MSARPCLPALSAFAGLVSWSGAATAAMPEGPPPPLALAWSLSVWTLAPLVALVVLYVAGARATRNDARRGEHIAFCAAVLAVILALVWPLDAYVPYLLSAHVAQHMTLLALVPPLLLAAGTGARVRAALPGRAGATGAQLAAFADRHLGVATLVHVLTMWCWHLPGAVAATMESEALHRLMLVHVLLAGLWFWRAVFARLRARDGSAAGACVALVTAMMLMGFLGALLTFSPRLLYPVYTDTALLAGIDPMRDQQLAGLLMWVPTGVPYLAVCLLLAVALLRELPRSGRPA